VEEVAIGFEKTLPLQAILHVRTILEVFIFKKLFTLGFESFSMTEKYLLIFF